MPITALRVIDASDLADLAYADVRFTQAIQDQNTLLCLIQVQRTAQNVSKNEIAERLTQAVQSRLSAQDFNVTSLVSISVLEPPLDQ